MSLLETFETLSLSDIESYISSSQEENLHLDFKTADPRLDREDRKNLARAIAGFANADGGMLVWGVATEKNLAGVEVATKLKLITSLSQFMAKLNQCTGEATNPLVGGVLHRKMMVDADSGLALTYVPPSDRGPHMAKCGEDRYYIRSGDRFAKMEHFQIADMFGRRPQPQLSIYYRLSKGGSSSGPEGRERDLTVFFGLRNQGRGAAKAAYLALQILSPYSVSQYGIDGNFNFGLESLASGGDSAWRRFGGGDGRYIYPGTDLDVATVQRSIHESAKRLDTMRVEYQLAADGVPLESGTLRIDGRELVLFVWPDDDA